MSFPGRRGARCKNSKSITSLAEVAFSSRKVAASTPSKPGAFSSSFPGFGTATPFARRWDGTSNWVGFSGQYADRLLRKGFLTPSQPVIKPCDEHSLMELFTQMFSEMRTERTGFSQIIGSITASMVANINAFSRSQHSSYTRSKAVIERVKSLLQERTGAKP